MTSIASISRPYAEAIFELATANKETAIWQELLQNLTTIMQDDKMQELVKSPKIIVAELFAIFKNILPNSNEQQLKFVEMLLSNKRMTIAGYILEHYVALCDEAAKIQAATIISAHALDKKQRQDIVTALVKKTGTEINASFITDKQLIGGLIIKIKDKVIDKSIRGMLAQMKHQIVQTKDISYAT